ncbi:MAG: phosphatase PAP2 family protein [Faecalibacterium sp.]|nr:phosphatase PAP2 family protein [Ruminococcus sp.]MCM1391386.1 phosphatase PAP2 family protein [Ruminococcus sp.]MCM1484596.1 phosphatase PAP2 family protein [Faecalibacterium sp.]
MENFFEPFLHFDLSVFEWVQTIQTPILSAILKVITTLGEGGIIFILLALVLLCSKKYRKVGFAICVALVVMEVCNNLVLKELFARPRPFNLTYDWWNEAYRFPEIVSRPDSYSFPSGHTSSAFAAAIAVLWYDRKIGIPTTIFACIMGFSRIYVEVHYCSDVLAGMIVGIIYAIIGVLVAKWLYPYFEKLLEKVLGKIKAKKA